MLSLGRVTIRLLEVKVQRRGRSIRLPSTSRRTAASWALKKSRYPVTAQRRSSRYVSPFPSAVEDSCPTKVSPTGLPRGTLHSLPVPVGPMNTTLGRCSQLFGLLGSMGLRGAGYFWSHTAHRANHMS